MEVWTLIQIIVNLLFLVGFLAMWNRLRKPAKDDPRLSRGLQLLQSKISVLEDLSDRTDRQVNQLTRLLENKARHLQNKFIEAEKQVQKLQNSMDRSMEVASIFQDKIPHSEIIERQNTIKHVQAARMANQGVSIEEIVAQVDLPREQLEFIVKVNKDQLVFDEQSLPAWVEERPTTRESDVLEDSGTADSFEDYDSDHSLLAESAIPSGGVEDFESLKKLGEQFKEACKDFDSEQEEMGASFTKSFEEGFQRVTTQIAESDTLQKAKGVTSQLLQSVGDSLSSRDEGQAEEGSQVVSPKAQPAAAPVIEEEEIPFVASEPGLNRTGRSTVTSTDVKTVKFPSIDLDDNLG